MHWLTRTQPGIAGAREEFAAWSDRLARELELAQAEAVVLHYSVFSYAYRGVPIFVRPTLSGLVRSRLPIVGFMHELAYPWHLRGLRGDVWAATQRVALRRVIDACAAAVVTAPFRTEWLASRVWLPRRRVEFAPVFSNLPAPAPSATGPREGQLGVFGYAYEGAARETVLDAVRLLHGRGLAVRLALLGAPGAGTPAGEAWLAAARARGIEHAISFSGVLEKQQLADALGACEVLLHPEPSGPTSRKGTLAASLASGRPVVAIDGPLRWAELVDSEAILVVRDDSRSLAEAVAGLLPDGARREALGRRGGQFALREMGVQRSVTVLATVLEDLLGRSLGA